MDQEVLELKEQVAKLSAEVKLLNARQPTRSAPAANPWLSLKEAAASLRFESARSLKQRILSGKFPPDCFQQIPSTTGKRTIYLVNVERYLKRLN